jgi:capsular polysaccharide biosynthesis protein
MVASVSILMSLLFFFIYDSLGSALFILMIAIAANARAADQPVAPTARRRGRPRSRRGRDLGDYATYVRRHAGLIGALMLLGALVGGGLAMTSPKSYAARTTVLMTRAPVYVDTVGDHAPPAVTVDTDAQLYSAPAVHREVSKRTGVPADEVESRLVISAEPLTRVLDVTFRGSTPEIARVGAQAAAKAMLHERREVLIEQNTRRLNTIRMSQAKLQLAALRLEMHGKGQDPFALDLADRIQVLSAVSAQLQDARDSPGQVMDSAHVVRTERARAPTKWAGSGAGLGLLLALALGSFRPKAGWLPRKQGRRAIPRVWDVSARGAG